MSSINFGGCYWSIKLYSFHVKGNGVKCVSKDLTLSGKHIMQYTHDAFFFKRRMTVNRSNNDVDNYIS